MSTKIESLAGIPLFEDLDAEQLASVADSMRETRIETGSELIREGEAGTEFFVVTEGSLEISVRGRVVRLLGSGDFLGELALLFGAPRSATAVALEPTTLLVMEKDDFTALMNGQPEVETKVFAVVAERIRYR